MLQNTVNRMRKFFYNDAEIFVVTTEDLYDLTREQLPKLPKENIIVEPMQRGTATCLSLAAHTLRNRMTDDTILTVFPADHTINNINEFEDAIELGMEAALKSNGIITIGLQPNRPETDYGYIQYTKNEKLQEKLGIEEIRECTAFAEKPDTGTAERFIQSGDFLWNSGIYIMRFSTFFEKSNKYLPDVTRLFDNLSKSFDTADYKVKLAELYQKIPNLSFDYGVLEKDNNVLVIKSSFDWTDINDWDEYYRLSKKDVDGNVIEGSVISVDNKNSLFISNNKTIGIIGLDDIMIIDNEDGLFICKKDESHKVSEIINYMKRNNIHNY